MIIGIDGNEANVEKKVGIGEYAFELLTHFKQYQGASVVCQVYLKNPPRAEMPSESDKWKYILVKPRKLWTQIGLPFYLYTHAPKPDIFFTPSHYSPRFSPVPTVVAVMDLSYIRFPELFTKHDLYQLVNWTRYSVKKAKKIFTISESSKSDIIKEYGVSPKDVIVTYPGIKTNAVSDVRDLDMKNIQEKFKISENYILFVGTLQPRKNIVRLIEAFARIKNQGSRIKSLELVIVGKKGWQYEEILAAPEKLDVTNRVKFLDFVSDEDLPSLYTHALCYVLPSLYEGFGLPVLEAMKYDCPVITSNVSSLPEAGGDAALYVDPTNVDNIAETIEKLISNENLRKELIEKGRKQIKKFSWEKTAKNTLEILEEIAKKN